METKLIKSLWLVLVSIVPENGSGPFWHLQADPNAGGLLGHFCSKQKV